MTRFSVVIVNYNGGDFVQGALDSLKAQTERSFEVFLVDNASTDGSADNLDTSGLPHFELIRPGANLGFAAANNLAAQRASGEWLALLNPDAAAKADWLEQIGKARERYPDTSMFASLQIDMFDPQRMDGAGDAYFAFGLPWRGGFGRPATDIPEEGECFSPCGAGAAIRRSVFLQENGFDERFFCFCEDVDLGFRLRLLGERCIFIPQAIIRHAGSALSGRVSDFSVRHGSRNRCWTYFKSMPPALLALTLPGFTLATLALLARGLVTGRAASTWQGLVDAWKGRHPIREARIDIQKRRSASSLDLAKAMTWTPLRLLQRRPHIMPLRSQGSPRTHARGQKTHH